MKPENVSTKQERIATLARSNPAMALTSLNHYLDYEWVRYAYECTRKDGAVGVDGQTADEYAANLEQNLLGLIDRLKSGCYKAPPVRRHYIEKSDGGQRGLGIPCFEDKVAQRAIVMLLEPIYEQDFLDCSFGFRPGRSAHQALQAAWTGIMGRGGRWVLDVDVRKYFASISHAKLRELLARRVTDGVVSRLIDKWLKAGVLEEGQLYYPDAGTPEGGVISPLMANVYLHYVLDEWFCEQVQPRMRGHSTLVRYCDDFVMVFAYKDDAERVLEVLGKRLGKYGLQLHPDKTRMVDFRFRDSVPHDGGTPTMATTFDFPGVYPRLGTLAERQRSGATPDGESAPGTCDQRHRSAVPCHAPLATAGAASTPVSDAQGALCYGITGNFERLASLYEQVRRSWRKWLSRRSNNSPVGWAAFERVLEHLPLPRPRIVRRYA